MAVKINFDLMHNVIQPSFVLLTKSGSRLGQIKTHSLKIKDCLNEPCEVQFVAYKEDYKDRYSLWDKIEDFKLLWVKDWNMCFEIYVETIEGEGIYKNVTAKSLGEAELSQINIYTTEINTENDIARDDYVPTVLYNNENHSASLLHRIMEKVPHYTIDHVDSSIANIQRTFAFDGKSIMDCFNEIAEEINCLFVIDCGFDSSWNLVRKVSVYDLESYCYECHERGEYISTCTNCGSPNITKGYGNDTGIFINTENLTDEITFTTDNGSVKNCFKMSAGDDLMTATIANANANGSLYLWYISDQQKEDMSTALVNKLTQYDTSYAYYQNEYQANISSSQLSDYNTLITKYSVYSADYPQITYPIVGFPQLMQAEYNVIDFYLYLKSGLMPTVQTASTNAQIEIAKLNHTAFNTVSVQNLDTCSQTTADSAVLSAVKTIIDSRYKVVIDSSSYSSGSWTGSITITNYSDDIDTATDSSVSLTVNDDYENFVKQKIDRMISKRVANGEPTDIVTLFNSTIITFTNEIKKYCLIRLKGFYDACQSCIDILTESGAADQSLWTTQIAAQSQIRNLYSNMYEPYYNRLQLLANEIKTRESELAVIAGVYDADGKLQTDGVQTLIDKERNTIQSELNLENYLGTALWNELCSYRREDTYKNDNYISDGLSNAQLFKRALEFIKIAKKEIIKSATMQHSISTTLKNLLVMPEFSPIVNQFAVGNWLRARVDGDIYKLRLVDYEIAYDNIGQITVNFSDTIESPDGISDIKSIIDSAKNMSSTYGSVSRQAEQAEKTTTTVNEWQDTGLDVTKTKIICESDNQTYTSDDHGLTFKKYDTTLNQYDNRQINICNSTISITDDNWETVKTAIGFYYYFDPSTHKLKSTYGVNGETIIGKLILGENLGIYNTSNNMTFDTNGLIITNGINTFTVNPNNANKLLSISKTENNVTNDLFYVDNNGRLHISGDGTGLDLSTDKVKFAFNNISQYIQFEDYNNTASICIYDSDNSATKEILMRLNADGFNLYDNNTLLMQMYSTGFSLYGKYLGDDTNYLLTRLTSTGTWYYYKYQTIGKIGTNSWAGDDSFRGLMFDLEHGAKYMGWGYQDVANGNYNVKLIYYSDDTKDTHGVHLRDDTYLDYDTYIENELHYKNTMNTITYVDSGTDAVTGVGFTTDTVNLDLHGCRVNFGIRTYNSSSDSYISYTKMSIQDNKIDCYTNLDMNNYSILNQSDIRLKTNVQDTNVNALSLLSKIDLKSFDWIETSKHENIGMIAQQLKDVIPDLVVEDESTGKLSIKMINFVPYLIKAIQELLERSSKKTGEKTKQDIVKYDDKMSMNDKKIFVKQMRDISKTKLVEQQKAIPNQIYVQDNFYKKKG